MEGRMFGGVGCWGKGGGADRRTDGCLVLAVVKCSYGFLKAVLGCVKLNHCGCSKSSIKNRH